MPTITGTSGNDTFEISSRTPNTDAIDGGGGNDTLVLYFPNGRGPDVWMDQAVGGPGLSVTSIETVIVAAGVGRIYGGPGAERFGTSDIGDEVHGGGGNDYIFDTNNFLNLAGPGEQLFGDEGDDTIIAQDSVTYMRGGDGADSMSGGGDFDDMNGNAGNDTIWGGEGPDWVVGGKDDDLLYGDWAGDIVYGNLGDDTCHGDSGWDLVRGGQGNDVVFGDAGDDWLSGDRGDDTVAGGAGADVFHGSQDAGIDRVTDFSAAQGDRVQLDPGTTYTLREEGSDTIIDMGGANRMVLVGVRLSSLSPGWIFGA